jgi:hypothetical protein
MSSREEISQSLEKYLPKPQVEPVKAPTPVEQAHDTEEDFEYSRDKLKGLIGRAEEAIDAAMSLAMEAEHPRAFEVVSQMIKNTSDITTELLKLQKTRKELHKEAEPHEGHGAGGVTNNAIFVGSTKELQKFLKKEIEEPEIVVIEDEKG